MTEAIDQKPVVKLRALEQDDEARLLEWRNRNDVRRYMYHDQIIDPATHHDWFAKTLKNKAAHFWVIEFSASPVGLVSLAVEAHGKATWAYYLAEPEIRGKAVGACVEFKLIEKAFGEFGIEKLWCEVLVSNEAAWKLHQSFGFEIEAKLRRHVVKSDGPHDVLGLGLLKADWAERRDACHARLSAKGFDI